jgi:hypothetical protein
MISSVPAHTGIPGCITALQVSICIGSEGAGGDLDARLHINLDLQCLIHSYFPGAHAIQMHKPLHFHGIHHLIHMNAHVSIHMDIGHPCISATLMHSSALKHCRSKANLIHNLAHDYLPPLLNVALTTYAVMNSGIPRLAAQRLKLQNPMRAARLRMYCIG